MGVVVAFLFISMGVLGLAKVSDQKSHRKGMLTVTSVVLIGLQAARLFEALHLTSAEYYSFSILASLLIGLVVFPKSRDQKDK